MAREIETREIETEVAKNARIWVREQNRKMADMGQEERWIVRLAMAAVLSGVTPGVARGVHDGVARAHLEHFAVPLSDCIERYLEQRVEYQWEDQSQGPHAWASGTLDQAAKHAAETGRTVEVFRHEKLIATFPGGE